MKLNYIIVLGFLIAFSISDETNCLLISNPSSKKDCNEKLSTWDKENNYKYCCFYQIGDDKSCIPYTQEMYDFIGEAKKASSGQTTASNVKAKLECNSSYLKLGLLSLLFFIF